MWDCRLTYYYIKRGCVLCSGQFFCGFLLCLATQKQVGNGRCDEDRRNRTEDDTKRHGESEGLDALSTEEENAEQHNQCRA